ncbi:MAG: ATP synthase F1 subunit delta [Candidatus Velthaea sp.]|jgi:F-type H+-transporting ATPase subunit delta
MANETLARRYATAIFGLAKDADAIGQVRTELHVIKSVFDGDERARKFFRSPVVDRKEKAGVIEQTFGGLHVIALHSVLLLVRKRREAIFDEIVAQYDLLEERSRGASPLRIESARELDPGELRELVDKLAQRYNTTFDVTQSVDPHLIGGVRITLGDKQIDGSVAGRLDDLARMLSSN